MSRTSLIRLSCAILVAALIGELQEAHALELTCGWEDGGTVLGSYRNVTATNVAAPEPIHSGNHSLKLVDGDDSNTNQAYVARVDGLLHDDTATAGFWRYTIRCLAPRRACASGDTTPPAT